MPAELMRGVKGPRRRNRGASCGWVGWSVGQASERVLVGWFGGSPLLTLMPNANTETSSHRLGVFVLGCGRVSPASSFAHIWLGLLFFSLQLCRSFSLVAPFLACSQLPLSSSTHSAQSRSFIMNRRLAGPICLLPVRSVPRCLY